MLENNLQKYRIEREEVFKLALDGKQKEALDKFQSIENIANEFQKNMRDLSDYNAKVADEVKEKNDAFYKKLEHY